MISLNPRTDLARFLFDDKFWIPAITDKYNQFLNSKAYPMNDIRDVVAESIKSWEIPGLGQTILKQPQFTGDGNQPNDTGTPSYENKIMAQEKELTLTFRMTDGMMNWMCLFEHAWAKLDNPKALVVSNFPIIIYNMYGQPIFNMVFENAIFKSIQGFGVDYQNFDRSMREFTCVWELDKFKVDFTPTRPDVKGYNPATNSTFEIPYTHDEVDVVNPPRPSL